MSRARRIAAALLLVVSIATADSFGQTNPAPGATGAASGFPWEGEVTGTNVRVRSGAGTDWYATTKVNTGDRVLVVGEQHGWYEIASLPRSFSYIDMAEVERLPGGQTARVKRDRTFVRAGSELNQSKSTTQAMLNQGAIVEVIGEIDGFFKIKPPVGAHLYISKDYVRPIAANLRTGMAERYKAATVALNDTAANRPSPTATPTTTTPPATDPRTADPSAVAAKNTPGQPSGSSLSTVQPMGAATTDDVDEAGEDDTPEMIGMEGADPSDGFDPTADVDAPLKTDPSIQALKGGANATGRPEVSAAPMSESRGRYQALLTAAESDLNAMMLLPLADRDIDTVISRYQEIAAQTEERVPAEYAAIRISQLKAMSDVRKIRAEASMEAGELDDFKARMTSERMKIMRTRAEKVTEKFDFVGQLLKSHAFAPEKRRYRLVDPKRQTTIAYIDIPRDVTENVEFMIGRTVGIRVAGRRYSQAARIPIAVAASLTDLTPPADSGAPLGADTPGGAPNSIMPPELGDEEPIDEGAEDVGTPQASGSNSTARPLASNTNPG